MLKRFASACLVGCVAIAIAVSIALATQLVNSQRFYLVLTIWCAAPCIWGVWAMLAPAAWVPQRLPLWGAFLGLIAGTLAAFVVNVPAVVLGLQLPMVGRGAVVLAMVVFYYCLWMIVRAAYRNLSGPKSMAATR